MALNLDRRFERTEGSRFRSTYAKRAKEECVDIVAVRKTFFYRNDEQVLEEDFVYLLAFGNCFCKVGFY